MTSPDPASTAAIEVILRIDLPTPSATGTFPLDAPLAATIFDSLSADPDIELTFVLVSTSGEVDVTANDASTLAGHFHFEAADKTGRVVHATGAFHALRSPSTSGSRQSGNR